MHLHDNDSSSQSGAQLGWREYCSVLSHMYNKSTLVNRLCFTYGTSAMVYELYPNVPTYNSTLALLCLYVTSHMEDFNEGFFRAFMLMLTISAIIDFAWIIKVSTGSYLVSV